VSIRHLDDLFEPASVAVIGASTRAGSVGATVWRNLKQGHFAGARWPVNLHHRQVDGDVAYATVAELPAAPALAVICTPPATVPALVAELGKRGTRATVVLTAGFTPEQKQAMLDAARPHLLRILGPNGLGLLSPPVGLNASFAHADIGEGGLALVSQSGALVAAMLDWARGRGIGFSRVVSLGEHADVDFGDMLDWLASDAKTRAILMYAESLSAPRKFMSAARAAARNKPVLMVKAGRSSAGQRAAASHTGALAGSDLVIEAAVRRAGMLRVDTLQDLFIAAETLAYFKGPLHGSEHTTQPRLAIVTNGGGPAVLAADWAGALGLEVAQVADLGEDADGAAYVRALGAALADKTADGVLLIHSPKADGDPMAVAEAIAAVHSPAGKPVVGCWLGEATTRTARELLAARQMPMFRTPEAAVDAFHSIASFYRNQQLLQQTPPPLSDLAEPDTEGARLLVEGVLAERRKVLTEMESKALLAAFRIPVTRTMLARSANEAMLIASQLGYPVALKIDSPDIAHKSDVHGVALGVASAAQVRERYEEMLLAVRRARPEARIHGVTVQPMAGRGDGTPGGDTPSPAREVYVGMTTDEPFGPVITFGAGGTMIELIADRAMELPPLNKFLAGSLIERARAAEMLGPWRGAPAADIDALEQILLRVSEMVCALPQLREMDINPIIVDAHGAVAVDARIVVEHAARTSGAASNYQHLAILPYPARQEQTWPLKGGGVYTVRPIRPDDADMLQAFVRGLSPESRWFRFASHMPELPARMLARYTLIDYDREMALVAILKERRAADDGAETESERIVGVSRYITNPDAASCEFSLVVADDMSGQGLGTRLMMSIIEQARAKGLAEIIGLVLVNNAKMLELMAALGFTVQAAPEDPDFKLVVKAL